MAEITIKLPRLTPGQHQCMASGRRFVIAAMGEDAGKTSLAIDAALTHGFGALRGYPVAFICATQEMLVFSKRQVMRAIEPLVSSKSRRGRVILDAGGHIDFHLADDTLDIWEQYSLVVIDDAHLIPSIAVLWEDTFRPLLSRFRGSAVIVGKANGDRSQFFKLFTHAAIDPDWARFTVPTNDNPHIDQELVLDAQQKLPDMAFRQEYMAEFIDGGIEFSRSQLIIGEHETFLEWCLRLADDGLKVDGHPFRLDNRPAMHFIYGLVPTTPEESYGKIDVIMKCAQVGFTVMEMLAMVYTALKMAPCKIGMYLPDMKLAALKSSERFMPIVRTVPDAYRLMVDTVEGAFRRGGEGNVMVRNMGDSRFHFLWTSGKATTESIPLDVVSFDEVQEMEIADMEKTKERLSASSIRYTMMGSTANWPDRDIHYWYKRGTQHQFWTECPNCGMHQVLDEHFPACIKYDPDRSDYRYECHECHGWIDDSQVGEWRAKAPDAAIRSVHFPQFLSPTISPREIIEAFQNADDLKNFYNRKLGKPYVDPSQVPVDLEMLNDCARLGMQLGLQWESAGRGYFMGIDQMGFFNVVLIAKRLPTGHMGIIHAEEIYGDDPFARCDELMEQYRMAVCVVETLPNYNDAKRFAQRHPGVVFLAGYADIKDEMLRWGDAPRMDASERRTSEDERDRFTVTLDQYKCMQVSMARIQKRMCLFPDPLALVQDIHEKGQVVPMPILKDRVFWHFTKTALVAIQDDEQKKFRRKVIKIGTDPHFSYAYMLLNVAWSRAHGTSTFLLPEDSAMTDRQESIKEAMPGLPEQVLGLVDELPAGTICGRCSAFDVETSRCSERHLIVRPIDPGCAFFDRS
jgi:hypothetical protein